MSRDRSGTSESAVVWLAERLPRRNLFVRAGAAITAALGGLLLGDLPQAARAASCGCCEGNSCGFQISCYRRCVCNCQDVAVRWCPGGASFGTLQHAATFDIQSPPGNVSGYRYGYAFGDVNKRGWVLEGCLKVPALGSCNSLCV